MIPQYQYTIISFKEQFLKYKVPVNHLYQQTNFYRVSLFYPTSFANCLVSRHVYNFDCTQKIFSMHLKHFFLFVRYMQIAVVLVDVCESCGAIESIVGHS